MSTKLDGKQIKEKKLTLIKEQSENNPDFQQGKIIVCCTLAAWVVFRSTDAFLSLGLTLASGAQPSQTHIIVTILTLPISFLFAYLIDDGFGIAVYLILFGGLSSLYSLYNDGTLFLIITPDILFNVSRFIIFAFIFIQIAGALILILNKKSRIYIKAKGIIRKELLRWMGEQAQ